MLITPSSHPGTRWLVWHVPRCCQVQRCLWVDDEACQYAVAVWPLQPLGNGLAYRVEQARRIRVDVQAALILIDPVDDAADAAGGAVLELVSTPQAPADQAPGQKVVSSRCLGAWECATRGVSARGQGPGFGAAAGNGCCAFFFVADEATHASQRAWRQPVRGRVSP